MRVLLASQKLYVLALCSLLLLYIVWLAHPITLITGDIGRHITDGRILLEYPEMRRALLYTNFYSLAVPDFPIINHHWAAGIIFALVQQWFGWFGLHALYMLLACVALFLSIVVARSVAPPWIVVSYCVLLLPMLAYRHEVRPEFMGYVFAMWIYWILQGCNQIKNTKHLLWSIPLVMVLWVNIHASFPVGFLLLIICGLQAYIDGNSILKYIVYSGIASVVAVFVNPSGLAGVLYPFLILRDPGYAVLENQSITFLYGIGIHRPEFMYAIGCIVVYGICTVALLWKKRLRMMLSHWILAGFALLMAFFAVRHITLAALFCIPLFAGTWHMYTQDIEESKRKKASFFLLIAVLASLCSQWSTLSSRWIVFGLEPGANAAAAFIKNEGLHGPYFNNFDIGGYLVYHLFPDDRPFVYNRPESHPSDFWRNTVIPMMQDDAIWEEKLNKYEFHTIVMYHGDKTHWAQAFLDARLHDADWAPVYVDGSVIIMVRHNALNASIIQKHEISLDRLLRNP